MRRKLRAALVLVCCLATASAAAPAKSEAPAKPLLTAEAALALAYENNPSLAAAESRIEQAKQQIAQARADKLPKLFTQLVGSWQGNESRIPVYGTAGPAYAVNGYEEVYQASLGVQYLLFSSGAVENTVAARRLAFMGVQAKEVRTGQGVENAVLVSYYDLQRARAKLTVAEEVLALSKEHLFQVESFFKYGVVAKNEVLRVQVDVSNGELNVISAKNAVDVRWRALERAVGTQLRSRYDLPEPERQAVMTEIPKWDDNSLYTWRPELKALDYSRRAALSVAAAASGFTGPKVVASGEVFTAGQNFWPDQQDTWKLQLSLRWDFFDGGKARAQVKEYKASAQELLSNIEDFKKQVALEVSSAQLNLESSMQKIAVATNQVASAEEDYRMALMRYKANVGTNLDVLDARTSLSNARTQLVDAVYDSYSGRANLDYALGLSGKYMLKEPDGIGTSKK